MEIGVGEDGYCDILGIAGRCKKGKNAWSYFLV
jgi:transposase-like protein